MEALKTWASGQQIYDGLLAVVRSGARVIAGQM